MFTKSKKEKQLSKREQISAQIATLEKERDVMKERLHTLQRQRIELDMSVSGSRLRGMNLDIEIDRQQEYIHRQYEKIAKALLDLAEIEKRAKYIKREYYITATGNRHLKAEARKAEIQRTLKELAPARKDSNTNVEKMCAAMEVEYKSIDQRCEAELQEYATRYIALMGVPVDSNGDEPEEEEVTPPMVYGPGMGRPRNSVRIDRTGQYS